MKKYFSLMCFTFLCFSAMAQEDNLAGKWTQRITYLDTLETGRKLVAKEVDAYYKGVKKLGAEYYVVKEVSANDPRNIVMSISKKGDYFWASNESSFQQKITYNPTAQNYFTTINGKSMIVKRDNVKQNLYFVEPISNYIYYEFTKIE
jgi:hypothetical protein